MAYRDENKLRNLRDQSSQKEQITALWRRGWGRAQIADSLGLSRHVVDRRCAEVMEEWKSAYMTHAAEIISISAARCEMAIAEAMKAWDNSLRKGGKKRVVRGEDGEIESVVEDEWDRDGDTKHLKVMLDAQAQLLNLLGIRPVFEEAEKSSAEYFQFDPSRVEKEKLKVLFDAIVDARKSAGDNRKYTLEHKEQEDDVDIGAGQASAGESADDDSEG